MTIYFTDLRETYKIYKNQKLQIKKDRFQPKPVPVKLLNFCLFFQLSNQKFLISWDPNFIAEYKQLK